MKKKVIFYVKLLVSLLFLGIVVGFLRRGDALSRLGELHWGFALMSLGWAVCMMAVSCLKWRLLLKHQGYRPGFGYLMKVYFIGYYFTNLLPSNVGGDVARSFIVGRRIGSQTHSAVSVFIERFSGVLLLLVLVAAAPLARPDVRQDLRLVLPALGACGLLVVIAVAAFGKRFAGVRPVAAAGDPPPPEETEPHGSRFTRLRRRVLAVLARFHDRLMEAVGYMGRRPRFLWGVIALTVLFYVMTWINVSLAFSTFRVSTSFYRLATVVPAAMLLAMTPISLGSLGLAEGVYVFYASLMGVSPADAALMGLFLRVKMLVMGGVGMGMYLHQEEETRHGLESCAGH